MNKETLIKSQQALICGKQMFDVEITTNCNKKCYLCPREKLTRTNRNMTEETFTLLCEWLPEKCNVFLAGLGEPLLHDSCTDFISKLHNSGRKTSIMTNGTLLTDEKINKLFSAGLDKLQISIIQKTDLEKISYFTELIPVEYKNLVVFNIIKEDKMPDASKELLFLKTNGWKYCIKLAHNRAGLLFPSEYGKELKTCATFFCDTCINADGEIHVCSNDINGKHNVGTISSMTFGELIEYKKRFLGNRQICPICAQCTDEYRLKHFEEI